MANAIFVAFDDNYFSYAKMCLTSLEKNYPDHPEILTVYAGENPMVWKFLTTINNLGIISIEKGWPELINASAGRVNSKMIYYRFALWSPQFDQYDNIVHLDVDTIILRPFDELFKKDFFYAILDFTPFGFTLFNKGKYDDEYLLNLLCEDGLARSPGDLTMMNAGVFVIPKRYRTATHGKALLDITKKYSPYTDFADQASISLWCHVNKIEFASQIEYNFQIPFLNNPNILFSKDMSAKIQLSEIHIVHFSWWKMDSAFYKSFLGSAIFLSDFQRSLVGFI